MKLSNIVNVIDTESACWPDKKGLGPIIEIGLTTIDLKTKQIIKSYSYPIKAVDYVEENGYLVPKPVDISPLCHELTGWTSHKLQKQGKRFWDVWRLLKEKHAITSRMAVADQDDELRFFNSTCYDKPTFINVSALWSLAFDYRDKNESLDCMLESVGLSFEGRKHSAKDDSYNIARLFLALLECLRGELNNPINRINKPIYEVLYVGDLLIQVQSLGNKDPLDKQLFIIDKFVKKFTPVLPD